MSTDGVAYSSTAQPVLDAWQAHCDHVADVRDQRDAMSARYGRRLMINRDGFGHGTRVVGFEQLDDDTDGDVLGDNGELRVPKKGPPYGTVVPNTRRKSGKDLAAELALLNVNDLELLPGMPGWTLIGFALLRPAAFRHDGTVWVRWADDFDAGTQSHDLTHWEKQPLSAYYAAQEAHTAAIAATEETA